MASGGVPTYKPTAVIEQVGVVRADRSAERAFGNAARFAGQFADAMLDEHRRQVIEKSTEAGKTAGMQRDADGRLIWQPVDATDAAARAYNEGGKAAYLASFANDARTKAADLSLKHEGDPDRFQAAWVGHMQGALEAVPPQFRPDAEIFLEQQGSQQYVRLRGEQVRQDRALQHKALDTQIKSLDGDLLSLARAGKIDAPEYQDALEKRRAAIGSAVQARFISKDLADEMDAGLSGEIKAQVFISDVMAGYAKRGGGPEAARWALSEADKLVNDPKALASLSPGQRERFRNLLQAEVREAETMRQIGWSELGRRFEMLNDDIAFGVVPKGLTALKGEAKALGHTELVQRIERVEQVGQAAAGFGKLSLPEQATKVAALRERWLAGDLNPTERSVYAMYEQTHQRAVREAQADPVRYAMRSQGDVPSTQRIVPLQFDDLAKLPAQLQQRAEQMRVAGARIGLAMPLLTKEEAKVIGSAVTAPDDPAAAETANRRFEMLRPILAAAQTDEQLQATRKALGESGVKESDLLAADPDMVQHMGVTMARRIFGALATKQVELPADIKKKLDGDLVERWRTQYDFNARQAAITGDGTVQRKQDLSFNLYRQAAYALNDPKQAYDAMFGASVLLDGPDYALRLPKALAEDRALLELGMQVAKERFPADAQPNDPLARRKLQTMIGDAQWANDRSGAVGLYLGGAKLLELAPAALIEMGRAAQVAERTAAAEAIRSRPTTVLTPTARRFLEGQAEAIRAAGGAEAKREAPPPRALDLNFGRPVR